MEPARRPHPHRQVPKAPTSRPAPAAATPRPDRVHVPPRRPRVGHRRHSDQDAASKTGKSTTQIALDSVLRPAGRDRADHRCPRPDPARGRPRRPRVASSRTSPARRSSRASPLRLGYPYGSVQVRQLDQRHCRRSISPAPIAAPKRRRYSTAVEEATMEVRQFGRSGVHVAEVCLGTMTFGRETTETIAQDLDRYLDAGGNFVDTANVYSAARQRRSSAPLAGRRDDGRARDEVPDAAGPAPTTGAVPGEIRSVEASLRRLADGLHRSLPVHCWDASRRSRRRSRAGRPGAVGQGPVRRRQDYPGWQLAPRRSRCEAARWEPFVTLQPQYWLVRRDVELEVVPAALGHRAWASCHGAPSEAASSPGSTGAARRPPADTRADGLHARRPSLMRMRIEPRSATSRSRRPSPTSRASWAGPWRRSRSTGSLHAPGVTAPILGRADRRPDRGQPRRGGLDARRRRTRQRLDDASAIERGYPYDFIDWIHAR